MPPDRGKRPRSVNWAVGMLFTSLILGFVDLAINSIGQGRSIGFDSIAGLLLGCTVGSWLYYKLWVGRNWARIALLILIVFSLPVFIKRVPELLSQGPEILGLSLLENLIEAFAIYLVFFPGRSWYAHWQP
jgi:hypothetical protein